MFLPRNCFVYEDNAQKYGNYLYFFARLYDKSGSGKIDYAGFRSFCYGLGFGRKGFHTMWSYGSVFRWGTSSGDTLYLKSYHKSDYRQVEVFGANLSAICDKPTVHKFTQLCSVIVAAAPTFKAKDSLEARSRTLRTIGRSTGTSYKQTVHNRLKKASKTFVFDSTKRSFGGVRVSSEYGVQDVTYRKDYRTVTDKPSILRTAGATCRRYVYGSRHEDSKVKRVLPDMGMYEALVNTFVKDHFSYA